jgi:transcription initiation factor TFIIB
VDEVAALSGTSKGEVMRCLRSVQRRLGLVLQPPSAMDHASRIMQRLRLDPKGPVARLTYAALKRAQNAGIVQGRNPVTIVAAAVYLAAKACGGRVTQKEIARVTYLTETTIRSACRLMEERFPSLAEQMAINCTQV